ncbi:MAG: DUF2085 domain-containing protein [Acidobacteriia bacterium]|nr:DUF2085 domain-containing protein [Terriglobia bacterium]
MHQLFSFVCGQVNVWNVGGVDLPFCERCTGLYVGGFYALLLMIVFRPAPGVKLLAVHVLLLLQMAPFGFHLVPHGAIVRTITGESFAFGLAYCLSMGLLDLVHRGQALQPQPERARLWRYALAAFIGMPLLLLAIRFGGVATARVLAALGLAGLGAYAALTVANLVMAPALLWRWMSQRDDLARS